ncbi:MAG: hypothetical protein AABX30_03125 [Nanoarchaeota archaeon]
MENETDLKRWLEENKGVKTYKDGRIGIFQAYNKILDFAKKKKWILEIIGWQETFIAGGRKIKLPILILKSSNEGSALWLISGIHGEEPAGFNAIIKNLNFLDELRKKSIPIVVLPLCNPSGYLKNWRYPHYKYDSRDERRVKSVGDSEHVLLSLDKPNKPREKIPSLKESENISDAVIKSSRLYPPILVFDMHEDKSSSIGTYIYSHGVLGAADPVARYIVKFLLRNNIIIQLYGKTRFGERIIDGVAHELYDGSIDELLSSRRIFYKNRIIRGPSAKSVVVIETPTRITLQSRIRIHSRILKNLEKFWDMTDLRIYEIE